MKKHAVPLIFLLLGFYFLFRSMGYATVSLEDEYKYAFYIDNESFCRRTYYQNLNPNSPTPSNVAVWRKKKAFHIENGLRTYNDAKNRCWFCPDLDDREKARYCFTSAAATIGNTSLQAKAVTALVTLLVQYGLDAMDEWNYIQEKLYWAEYHFDMAAFYDELLSKA